jgi:hypothetical protein
MSGLSLLSGRWDHCCGKRRRALAISDGGSRAGVREKKPDALTPGKHSIEFDYTYDGLGIAKGVTGVLKVDGKVVATEKQPNSIAFLQVADETFDVGLDTRTAVNDKDYQVPFAFNGTISKLTVKLGRSQLLPAKQKKAAAAVAKARD